MEFMRMEYQKMVLTKYVYLNHPLNFKYMQIPVSAPLDSRGLRFWGELLLACS
jgi:hypothetical protein